MCKKEEKNFPTTVLARDMKRRRKKYSSIINNTHIIQTVPFSWSSASLQCHLQSRHFPYKTCLESSWRWSTTSAAILLNHDKQILFHPRVSSSTEVVLADRPLPCHGKHYWEIYMPAIYGTSIMFGIASKLIEISI